MGTGAFTSASMARDANVTVANDANAYIQLVPGGARGVGGKIGEENGELYIDLGRNAGGSGVNDDSRYQLGAMNDEAKGDQIDFESLHDSDTDPDAAGNGAPWVSDNGGTDQSAIVVHNQSGQTLDIEIGLNTESSNPGATVYLQGSATEISGDDGPVSGPDDPSTVDGATATNTATLDLDDPTDGQSGAKQALSFNNDNDPDEAIPPGESVYVSMQVDTRDDETAHDTDLAEELVVSANNAADPGVE